VGGGEAKECASVPSWNFSSLQIKRNREVITADAERGGGEKVSKELDIADIKAGSPPRTVLRAKQSKREGILE